VKQYKWGKENEFWGANCDCNNLHTWQVNGTCFWKNQFGILIILFDTMPKSTVAEESIWKISLIKW